MTFFGLSAYAQTAPAASSAGQGFDFMGLAPLLLIGAVMYFFLFRPQQKKMKEHTDMVSALRRGDKIVTSGGIFGTIHKIVSNEEVTIEIAEGVTIRVLKNSISQVLAKPEPIDVKSAAEEPGEKPVSKDVKKVTKPTISRSKKETKSN